jgi:hypothetical protein
MDASATVKRALRRLQGRLPGPDRYREQIALHARGATFVDVGCMWKVNGGYAFHALAQGAAAVTGVDVMPATPEFLAENARHGNRVRFVEGDINDPKLLDVIGPCEVVFCSGVLYHMPNPLHTLERLRAVCRGMLLLGSATIPEQSIPQAAVFLPLLSPRARSALHNQTPDTKVGLDTDFDPAVSYSNWYWGLAPSCVEAMARTAGFSIVKRFPFRRSIFLVCR